jgi:hypothetical protein
LWSACPADEGLPVVVERLDPPDRGAVLGEGEDLVVAFVERVVEPTKGEVVAPLRATQDAAEALRPSPLTRIDPVVLTRFDPHRDRDLRLRNSKAWS